MTFPVPYTKLPESVKLKTKNGEVIGLSFHAEEMATWWAEAENTEFGEKDKVKENFWSQFKPFIDKVSLWFIY